MKLLRRPIGASDRIPDRFCVISMEFLSAVRRLQNYEHCKYSLAKVTLESFENWIFCLAWCRFYHPYVGLWKKKLQKAKKLVKMIG